MTKSIKAEGFPLPAQVDGYAFYGTWSVIDAKGRICLPILGPEGERPDDAEEIAQMVADAINTRGLAMNLCPNCGTPMPNPVKPPKGRRAVWRCPGCDKSFYRVARFEGAE